MKITTDTNVLVSSTFWYGDSDRILRKVENKEIDLVLSGLIIEEFSHVLDYANIQDKSDILLALKGCSLRSQLFAFGKKQGVH